MQDVIFLGVTILFFVISLAYVRSASGCVEAYMSAEPIIMLIICAGLLVYLVYAMLRPEKF